MIRGRAILSRIQPAWAIGLGALAVAHVALGLGLAPGWSVAKYPVAAELWRSGKLDPARLSDFSPLYFLLSLAFSPAALRVIQSIAGGLAVVGVGVAVRRAGGLRGGLAAAALAAFCAPVLTYEAVLEPDLLILACGVWALALLGDRAAPRLAVAGGGLLLGLDAALRPSALLLIALSAGWLALVHRARPARAALFALTLAAGALAALAPVWAFQRASGAASGGTMSAGAVVHMGNRPEGSGLGAQPPQLIKLYERQVRSAARPDFAHELYRRFAEVDSGAPPGFAREAYWISRVAAFARWEPASFAALQVRKIGFYLLGPDGHDLGEAQRLGRRLGGLPLVPAEAIMILGIAGLALQLRRRELSLEALFAFGAVATAVAFYVVARYRVALMPGWLALAGTWLAASAGLGRSAKRIAGWLTAPALAALALVLLPFLTHQRQLLSRGQGRFDADSLEPRRSRGGLAEATEAFARLQAVQPYVTWVRDFRGIPFESRELARASGAEALQRFGSDDPVSLLFLAELASRAGECRPALEAAQLAGDAGFRASIFDRLIDPDLLRATCLRELGLHDDARRAIVQALSGRPGTLEGLSAAIAAGAGDAEAMERELFALHGPLSAHFALARALNDWGRGADALPHAEWVLGHLDSASAWYERARAEASLGLSLDATRSYARALELFPAFSFPTLPLDAAVRAALAAAPGDPDVLSTAAEHCLRQGRIADARSLAEKASLAFGPNAPAWHLERVRFLSRATQPAFTAAPNPW